MPYVFPTCGQVRPSLERGRFLRKTTLEVQIKIIDMKSFTRLETFIIYYHYLKEQPFAETSDHTTESVAPV